MSITLYIEQVHPIIVSRLVASTSKVLAGILALSHGPPIDASYENAAEGGPSREEHFWRESSPLAVSIRGEPERVLVMPLSVAPTATATIHYFTVNLWGPRTPLGYALMAAVAGAIGFDQNQEIEDDASFFTDHETLTPSEFVRSLQLCASRDHLRDAAAAFLEKTKTRTA